MNGRDEPAAGVLFLCVANSARSQMAEGLARALAPRGTAIASAGSAPGSLHPMAVTAMRELGIDISEQFSKGIEQVDLDRFGSAVTLCAEESCPTPGIEDRLHWPVDDPASSSGSAEEQLGAFRRVRDEIRARLQAHFGW